MKCLVCDTEMRERVFTLMDHTVTFYVCDECGTTIDQWEKRKRNDNQLGYGVKVF